MAVYLRALWILIFLVPSSKSSPPDIIVVTPNVLQSDIVQSVLVSVSGVNSAPVHITLEDRLAHVYSNVGNKTVRKGVPQLFKFRISCKDIPVSTVHSTRFVNVRVRSTSSLLRIDKKVRVIVSCNSASVFVQTDKPVYTTSDIVHMRIISVDPLLKPQLSDKVTVDIKNPDDIVIDRLSITAASSSVIKTYQLHLGLTPILGKYTIIAKYGFKQQSVSKFYFEVMDYVLPRFDVHIIPPKFVTATQENIEIKILARYTYGKGLIGTLDVRLGICLEDSLNMRQFLKDRHQLSAQDKGKKDIIVPNEGYDVFPLDQKLCIVVEATERASGITQSATDTSTWFTDQPVRLDCELSPPFYRPRLLLPVTVRATYPDGQLAVGILVNATIKGVDSQRKRTSKDGLARFNLNVGNPEGHLEVFVKSALYKIRSKCVFHPFQSDCGLGGRQLTIQSKQEGKLEVGRNADFRLDTTSIGDHNQSANIVIVIISRGAIQGFKAMESTTESYVFQIPITANLANQFCLLAYFTDSCGALAADKTCVQTSNKFENDVSISVESGKKTYAQPGDDITLSVMAAKDSDIALLAIDKGLYILNSKNKLTQEQVFNDLTSFDKSCGYSGINTQAVIYAAGVSVITHKHLYSTERNTVECSHIDRERRQSSIESGCLCRYGKDVANSVANDVKNSEKVGVRLQSRCNKLYKNPAKLVSMSNCGPVTTTEEMRTFLTCCLWRIYGVRRGRTLDVLSPSPKVSPDSPFLNQFDYGSQMNSPSEYNDIIEFQYEHPLKRRTYFPHSWLWNMKINLSNFTDGVFRVTERLPDSITNWIFHGIALSNAKGFGIAKPKELQVFKNIFVECHLPYSLRRQEQVSVACTVYNYNENQEKVCLRLLDVPEDMCTIAGFQKQTNYFCHTVEGLDTLTVSIPILPLRVGITEFTVQVRTEVGGDEVVQKIRVVPEGVLREYDYSNELDPQGINIVGNCFLVHKRESRRAKETLGVCYTDKICGQRLPGSYTKLECCESQVVQYSVAWGKDCQPCPRMEERRLSQGSGILGEKLQINKYYIRVPDNYVEGSVTAWLGVTGRYLEANMKPVSGIEDLLRLPGGCGEQSLLSFASNVAITKYLMATGNLDHDSAGNLLDLIKRGYIYHQKFRHASGGFRPFINKDPATFVSAFVLRTFCSARHLILIDDQVIFGILHFLVNESQKNSGAFFDGAGEMYMHRQWGGVRDRDVSLTAYVVVSMLDCLNSSNNHRLSIAVRDSICKAIMYLNRQQNRGEVTRTYSKALLYYALSKSCNCFRVCKTECQVSVSDARHQLDLIAKNEGCSKHWEEEKSSNIDYTSAVSVEMSAYVLCGYVCDGDVEEARPIARWLNQQRNFRGAFVSTQDTVIALTCLAEFAKKIRLKHDLIVNVTALHSKDFHRQFVINNDNYQLTQRTEVPTNDVLTAVSIGEGLGIAQVHVEYNTPVTIHERCDFDFNITARLVHPSETHGDQMEVEINISIRYLGVNSKCTNMAIVDVQHLSGFRPCSKRQYSESDSSCLEDTLKNTSVPRLSSYNVTERSVEFYFQKICSTDAISFNYTATQKFEVKHQVPVSAEVYDYYSPEISCTKFFTLEDSTPKIDVLCLKSENKNDPFCACEQGICPKLEAITDRSCKACSTNGYVFKIRVVSQTNENGWINIQVKILQVFNSNTKMIEENSTSTFYLPSICEQFVLLENGKEYHVHVQHGRRYILDHTSRIEPWPANTTDCLKTEMPKCVETTCYPLLNITGLGKICLESSDIKAKCKKSLQNDACANSMEFEKYIDHLKDKSQCKDLNCQGPDM